MKKSVTRYIGGLLCTLFWLLGRLTCQTDKEQVFGMALSASIIPQVIYTKAMKIKVMLTLSDYPPEGTTISADCAITPLFNFTMDDSFDVAEDENSTIFSILFRGKSVDLSLLQQNLKFHRKISLASSEILGSINKEMSANSKTWKLETSTVTFTSTIRSHQLIATCQELPSSRIIEGAQLQCTLSSDSPLTEFGLSHIKDPVALLVADLSPAIIVNWAAAPPVGSTLSDRAYPNPAYVEVAPCPCDLIDSFCDINCCCDQDCDNVDQNVFTCIDGLSGGYQTPKIIDGHCTHQFSDRADWFPFMCLTRNNSPYLGMYYPESMPIVQNAKSMRLLTQQLTAKGKLLPESKDDYDVMDANIYRYGDPILTIVGVEEQAGYLTLPARIFTGQCIEASPLAFLLPQSVTCNIRVTPELCDANSILSATTYLMSSNSSDLHVLARKDMQEIANVTVTYFCEERVNGAPSSGSEACDFIRLVPSYNSRTKSCENVVHRLAYNFSWEGPVINRISVSIFLLSSFPVNLDLTQYFQSLFVQSSLNTSDSDNYQNTTPSRMVYSGNPGYNIGETLITGALVGINDSHSTNDTDISFMDVNHTVSVRLAYTGPDGTCDTQGQPVLFGINGFSGCRLDVYDAFAEDCRRLRIAALQHLCSLMPSTFVSKGGAPQQAQLDDFVPIIREDPCDILNATFVEAPAISNSSQETSDVGVCTNVPSYFAVTVLYAARGYLYGYPIYQIEGMRIRAINTTLAKCSNPSSRKAGGCWDSGHDNLTSMFVTSSVEFAETPADLNPKTKRFWLIQYSLPCSQDSCWAEIGYPFTDAQFGDDILYVAQCGLLVAALTTITLYFARTSLW